MAAVKTSPVTEETLASLGRVSGARAAFRRSAGALALEAVARHVFRRSA